MNYSSHLSKKELNSQLLTGIKRHLMIAQDTSAPKHVRMTSLNNLQEVIEFVLFDMNSAISEDEVAIYTKFFNLLIVKIGKAKVEINHTPIMFVEEIAFISVLAKM